MGLWLTSCIWERQAVQHRNAVDATRADAERVLSVGTITSNAHCARSNDSQAAKEEDANQLNLPLPLHMKIPNYGKWHENGSEIRGHVEHPKNYRH